MERRERWLAGGASVVLLALATATIFRTVNEGAAIASLIIAALFGLMAVTGRPIIGLELTKDRIALELGRAAARIAPSHPEQAQELAAQAVELASSPVHPQLDGMEYESAALEALGSALIGLGAGFDLDTLGEGRPLPYDAVVTYGGHRLAVETKYFGHSSVNRRLVSSTISKILQDGKIEGLLLIVGGAGARGTPRDWTGEHPGRVVAVPWQRGDSPSVLRDALDRLAGSLAPH